MKATFSHDRTYWADGEYLDFVRIDAEDEVIKQIDIWMIQNIPHAKRFMDSDHSVTPNTGWGGLNISSYIGWIQPADDDLILTKMKWL